MEHRDFDDLFVETVGVGQAEFGVDKLVDCVVLVLMPESGDQVQAMKAGVVEIAGVIVVNKADLPGAGRIAAEVRDVLARRRGEADRWAPPVILASQDDAASQQAVAQAIEAHFVWHRGRDDAVVRRRARAAYHVQSVLHRRIEELLADLPPAVLDAPLRDVHREIVTRLSVDLDASPSSQRRNSCA
jgi:LAO/AO transport system kinase